MQKAIIATLKWLSAIQWVRRYLKAHDLKSGLRWEEVIESLDDAWSASVADDLTDLIYDLRINGRKRVSFYKIDEKRRRNLLAAVVKPEKGYPGFPIHDAARNSVSGHVLVGAHDTDGYRHLVFCSHRSVTHEEDLPKSLLKNNVPPEVLRAESIVYRSVSFEEACDVVSIPKTKGRPLEIRVQLFDRVTTPRHVDVVAALRERVVSVASSPGDRIDLIDLAPAMRSIYDTPDEGNVVAMDFLCSTDTFRQESAKGKGTKDLRIEAYHSKGSAAIQGMFKISRLEVQWELDDDATVPHPRLVLPGNREHVSATPRLLDEAVVPQLLNSQGYAHVVDRLVDHLHLTN